MTALLQAGTRGLAADPTIWNMVMTSDWVAKSILLILLVFSIVYVRMIGREGRT